MSINPPIMELQLIQSLTLKIQCQGHGWGHTIGAAYINLLFVSHQSAQPKVTNMTTKIFPHADVSIMWSFKEIASMVFPEG